MRIGPAHLPTGLLLIGYPLFWLELWLHPGHQTSWAATVLFGILALWTAYGAWLRRPWEPRARVDKQTLLDAMLVVLILGIAALAALKPLHLLQEFDALNYHYGLPRQHLIRGSFAHLGWSAADLWPLPVQFALAPFWFATPLPNKWPQFVFLLGLVAVAASLSRKLSGDGRSAWMSVVALLGSHGLAIQFGTAMLDIPNAYLGLAAVDSWLAGRPRLAAVEGCFFFWSKSFMPIQLTLAASGLLLAAWMARRCGWRLSVGFEMKSPAVRKRAVSFFVAFLAAGAAVGMPFALKSLHYAGTPLFPFKALAFGGTLGKNPVVRRAVESCAAAHWRIKDAYGTGHDFLSFISHFWRIAVPDQGVNNTFDYPLGLPLLLFLGPFAFLVARSLASRRLPLLAAAAILFWSVWWAGSQQARWLYWPLCIVFVLVSADSSFAANRALRCGLTLSLFLTLVSIGRSHRPDFWKGSVASLRDSDRRLREAGRRPENRDGLVWANKEIAYAEAPVTVLANDPAWVLPP